MKINFADEELEDFCKTGNGKARLYKRLKSNASFMRDLSKVLRILYDAESIDGIRNIQSLSYEPLKYDRRGTSSVRIGYKSKYRLIFTESESGIEIIVIEISEHYGDK